MLKMHKKHQSKKSARRTIKFEERKTSSRKWIAKYEGENIFKAYRKHFHVDRMTAYNEMKKLGYDFSDEETKKIMKAEEDHQKAVARRREKKRQERIENFYQDCDDRFFYIAGYTSGGAPYGVTWEEMGMKPYQYFEDIDGIDEDIDAF